MSTTRMEASMHTMLEQAYKLGYTTYTIRFREGMWSCIMKRSDTQYIARGGGYKMLDAIDAALREAGMYALR